MAQVAGPARTPHGCLSCKRPSRLTAYRLRCSVAAKDRPTSAGNSSEDDRGHVHSVLLGVDDNVDGTVTYHFGAECDTAATASTGIPGVGAPNVAKSGPALFSAPAVPLADSPAAAVAAASADHAQHGQLPAVSSAAALGTAAPEPAVAVTAVAAAAAPETGMMPPPWQLHDAEQDGHRHDPSSRGNPFIHSSSHLSDAQPASTHELPYLRNGWYDPPYTVGGGSSSNASSTEAGSSFGNGAAASPRATRQRRQEQRSYYGGAATALQAAQAAAQQSASMDYREVEAAEVVAVYEALCDGSDLDGALGVIKECIKASRTDILARLKHYRFLRPAARQRAVKQALRFVQLLPRRYADARTYNMLLRVCAEAGDLRNAMHVSDMLQAAGLRLDAILYTTLISACAAAGDAEKAFQLYAEMRANGVPRDKMVFASVVKACAEQIDRLPQSERRQQLVLLERAFHLVDDMREARIPGDAAVFNALVTAAGRAGQLQRAFNVLEEMLHSGSRPNDRTYTSLIDACARAGDKELALRVYRKAQRESCAKTLMVYSSAVNACIQAAGGCDSKAVMSIYGDVQRNGVEPDNQLFGMLMKAAGAAGDLQLALGLQQEMLREGLKPCRGTQSALMAVHIRHNQLSEAQRIFRSLRAAGQWPQAYALNALLNAYANSFRLGDVVSLLCEMAEGQLRPDSFTFSAIFNACQRADEAELALDVARLMKLRGVRMDETHAVILLRICYNRLRQHWVPGGYPPNRSSATGSGTRAATSGLPPGGQRAQLRQRLLEALTPPGRLVDLREPGDVAWVAQAFSVYREALAAGVKPSLRLLNRMLMCLRVAWEGKAAAHAAEGGAAALAGAAAAGPEALLPHHLPTQLGAFGGARGGGGSLLGVPRQEKIGIEGVYHVQAVSILEEAIIGNVVPAFKTDSTEPIDLRGLPPAVAEVYVLTVLSAVQRQCEARRVIKQNLVFLVPPYDGSKVFMPSHLLHAHQNQAAAAPGSQHAEEEAYDSDEEDCGYSFAEADEAFARASTGGSTAAGAAAAAAPAGDARTGLGVAGVLRRLRLWAREYGDRGFVLLEAKELTRWCKATARAAERRSASALAVQKPYGQAMPGRGGLQQQQSQIRMGY